MELPEISLSYRDGGKHQPRLIYFDAAAAFFFTVDSSSGLHQLPSIGEIHPQMRWSFRLLCNPSGVLSAS
jgi:hypothetical protein